MGYLLALIGLAGLFANSTIGRKFIPFINEANKNSILIGSLAFIIIGILVVVILGGKRGKIIKQVAEEVPIYKGEGRKRKIVGYKAED